MSTVKRGGKVTAKEALEEARGVFLREYVRGKALLFADEPSGVDVLFTDEERRSVSSRVSEAYRGLLCSGLSEKAIAYRAKELALELLDF